MAKQKDKDKRHAAGTRAARGLAGQGAEQARARR